MGFGIQQIGVGTSSYLAGSFTKNLGYGNLLYFLTFIGCLATLGNVVLLYLDGVNPLGKEKKECEESNNNQVEAFQDITVSRLSCANYDENLQQRDTELMPLRVNRGRQEDQV